MATVLWSIVDSVTGDTFIVDSPVQPTTSPLSNPVDPTKTSLLNAIEKNLANDQVGYVVIDASGSPIVFVKFGTTFIRIDIFQELKRQWAIQQNGGLTSFNTIGFLTSPTVNGTNTSSNDSDGQWLAYATVAIIDRDAGWISTAFTQVQRQNIPVFDMLVKTGSVLADIQNVRIWNGLFSGSPVASALPALHLAGFRYDTSVDGTAFWRCVTNDGGGVGTVTTTTVAVVQNTSYKFRIDMSSSGNVKFYINDTLVATHTTTLPGSTQNLGHVENLRTLAAATKNYKISRIFMEHI